MARVLDEKQRVYLENLRHPRFTRKRAYCKIAPDFMSIKDKLRQHIDTCDSLSVCVLSRSVSVALHLGIEIPDSHMTRFACSFDGLSHAISSAHNPPNASLVLASS